MRAGCVVAVVALGILATPTGSQAQSGGSRALGSPVPPGTPMQPSPTESASPPTESASTVRAPHSYDEIPVPPPPATTEPGAVRHPSEFASWPGSRLDDGGLRIPSAIATRLRALDSDFQALAARGGSSIVDGILSILAGGLSITMGILIGDYNTGLSPYLYVYGGASVLRGSVHIVLTTNPAGTAIAFAHMPMTTMDEVEERLAFGERELAGLADRARLARIFDGSINVASGLAFFPIFFGINEGFPTGSTIAWFVMIGAAISAMSGVVTLLNPSEAERRWSAYEELRDRLAGRGGGMRDGDRRRTREEGGGDAVSVVPPGLRIEPWVASGGSSGFLGLRGRF